LRQKCWRTQKCIINTENIHKYLQQQNQAKTYCKNHQNIGTCLKYSHMYKILALAQNVGGFPKYRREMYVANVGGKCWQQMYAANVCGKCRRQTWAAKYRRQM
jgi:hypothetical protein